MPDQGIPFFHLRFLFPITSMAILKKIMQLLVVKTDFLCCWYGNIEIPEADHLYSAGIVTRQRCKLPGKPTGFWQGIAKVAEPSWSALRQMSSSSVLHTRYTPRCNWLFVKV